MIRFDSNNWHESDHPRDEIGQFSKKAGGSIVHERENNSSLPSARQSVEANIFSLSSNAPSHKGYALIDGKLKKSNVDIPFLGANGWGKDKRLFLINKKPYVGEYGAPKERPLRELTETEKEEIKDKATSSLEETRRAVHAEQIKFEKEATNLGERLADRGYKVRVVHPEDSTSRYVYVSGQNGTIKIRFADHSQAIEGSKEVGGYSRKLGVRHEAADYSIDPWTRRHANHSDVDAETFVKTRLEPFDADLLERKDSNDKGAIENKTATLIAAGGILLLDTEGRVLFLKRSKGSDMPGTWCFPGGKVEDGEDVLTAAVRECKEETGYDADPKTLRYWTQRCKDDVDFTTYLCKGVATFAPHLGPDDNPEHVAYAWAPIDSPPEPLHPGAWVSLARFSMNELGVAKAIAAGELTSPQHYMNIDLFALRISGTGVAFRNEKKDPDSGKVLQKEEFVYRRPENYLTEEFLERCNGLPVVLMHPGKAVLDSDEFASRIVGTILYPYIRDDEVWGVAKIYDAASAEMMRRMPLSTSPGVLLGNGDQKLKLEDGTNMLLEGAPSLVDHLAICAHGVWDKDGPAAGVESNGVEDVPLAPKPIGEDVMRAIACGIALMNTKASIASISNI